MAAGNKSLGRVQPRRHPAGAARHAADRGDLRHRRQRHPARAAPRTRRTGKENKITIKANSGLTEDEIQQMVKDAELQRRRRQEAARAGRRRATRPTRWCTACKKSLAEYGDKLDAGEKEKIEAALKDAEEALKGDDKADDRGQDRGADDGERRSSARRCTPTRRRSRPRRGGARGRRRRPSRCRSGGQAGRRQRRRRRVQGSQRQEVTARTLAAGAMTRRVRRVRPCRRSARRSALSEQMQIATHGKARLLRSPRRRRRTPREDDIKKAYRKLAMKHHPDRNPGDEQEGRGASSRRPRKPTRCCPTRRSARAYDQYGHAGVDPNMRRRRPAREGFGGFAEAFGDIFGDIFGGGAAAAARRGGQQVYRGATCATRWRSRSRRRRTARKRRSASRRWDDCETCNGTRRQARHQRQDLHRPATAQGTVQHAPGLLQRSSRPARTATARGKIIPEPCATCHGAGHASRSNKTLEVKIPAGIDDGMRIRCAGNGEPGTNGGPPGDLYVEIRIKQHAVFERDGDDLHCEVPVGFTHGGARRRDRGADARRQGRDRRCPKARRRGKTVPPARQGHQGRALQLSRATCTATSASRRRSSSPSTSASC